MTTLVASYDLRLVALSILVAILASGAALDLAGRVTAAKGRVATLWLAGGAFAMGLGIWSMHYTGMLAFQLPVPVRYHLPTVGLSLFAAVAASTVALFVASLPHLGATRVVIGSVVMGSGIAGMHYIGMAAMRLPAQMTGRPALIVLSVVIAIAVSAVALLLAFRFGHDPRARWTLRKVAAAGVMGFAVCSMHYTGMAAARFVAAPSLAGLAGGVSVTALGAVAIAGTTFIVLILSIVASLVARYGEERLRVSAALLSVRERQLAEAQAIAHVGSWELDMTTNVVTWSEEAYRLYGVPMGTPVGYETFVSSLHPDDRERVERVVGEALKERRPVEFEHRIVRPDGVVRYLLGRNVVILNGAGEPVRLAGTSLDITERKAIEDDLRAALLEVKTLRGYLRVCANCRRVLGQDGDWEQLESYVRRHSEAEFSHGICPDCAKTWAGSGSRV